MDFHPIANLFPLMEGAEFDALVEDIRVNGLRDSITTYEEKILDGRNRFNACEKAGRKPQFVTLSGEDPYAFVTSKNLRRRNMTFEQRAFVAEAMATMKQGANQHRPTGLPSESSLPDAAKLLGVSVKSVQRARVVKNEGDEQLVADVKSKKTSLRAAAEKVRAAKPKQEKTPNKRERLFTRRRSKAPREGMMRCEQAESAMNHIRIDDLERTRAFAHLRRWLDAHE
jgi:hypothetical protein